MPRVKPIAAFAGLCLLLSPPAPAQDDAPLPGTKPLTNSGDLSAQMVAGIDQFLLREIDSAIGAGQAIVIK